MGKYILSAILGYLIGNIASSYFIGKKMKNIDIRKHGSGNAGATNTFRVLGLKAGALVFIADIVKGALAAAIGLWITGDMGGAMLTGVMAVVGHDWPVLLNFKGGKGIATSFGLMLVLFPEIALILFLVAVPLMILTSYVSVGSVGAAVLFPILLVLFQQPQNIVIMGIVVSMLAIIRHKDNLVRLWQGNENKFSFKKQGR